MKITFFNPPVHHYAGIRFKMLPLIGLPTLTAWFNSHGHQAETHDLEAQEVNPTKFLYDFSIQHDVWPDVCGVTGLSISKRGMREIIQSIRNAGFKGTVVAGGVYATLYPQDPLDWGADLVITGECEGNVIKLIEDGAKGIHKGKPADITEIPAPDWSHFTPHITTYESNLRLLLPSPGISMWTRGCPWNCLFCGNAIFGGRPTRYRPPAHVEADMTQLRNMGVQNVYVYDDELIGTKLPDGWMKEIADRINPLGLYWLTQGRCSKKHITPEIIRDMLRAGGHTVFWGVESFSPKVLKAMRKGTSLEDIWYTLRTAREQGLNNAVFIMIGNYQETDEDLALTADALGAAYREGLIQMRQTTICSPMEGTEMARLAEKEGWYVPAPEMDPFMLQHSATPWLSVDRMNYWMAKFDEVCPVSLYDMPDKSRALRL
jgi:radical SAM superfamily enzyme YgiQ (UPF0313 family)